MFYRGTAFPAFKGNFFFGCLRGEGLNRVELNGRNVVVQELLITKYGRIRGRRRGGLTAISIFRLQTVTVAASPTDDDDRIIRLVPTK
jgi:glucose/arabinose dehydrogenase